MATTIHSDLKVYQRQTRTAATETLQQNIAAITSGTNGAIIMGSDITGGDYMYESFFQAVDMVSRQDINSVAAATASKLTQTEFVDVKVHRRFQVDTAKKAFSQANFDIGRFNMVAGEQIAKQIVTKKVNDGLLAVRTALANTAAVTNDVTAATVTSASAGNLINTLRKFGDSQDRIVAWVGHSTPFYDLGLSEVANKVDSVYGTLLRSFDIPTLGRPFIVTDSASLIDTTPNPDHYFVLGLTQGALRLMMTGVLDVEIEDKTGYEQLLRTYQGEYDFSLGVKGYAWNVGAGGANPTAASIGTAANWVNVASDPKSLAGVVLKCLAA